MKECQGFCDYPACDVIRPSKFDTIIEWLLAVLLVFMPLAFGVVHAWSEEVVIVLSGAILICFLLKLVCHSEQHFIWTWAYVPAGIFLLLAVIQLVPLPVSLVRMISPNTAIIKTELLGDLPNGYKLLKSMCLSFYPFATKHDLRLVLSAVALFIVVHNVFRHSEQIKRLLTVIALIGGTVALLTLAQALFGNGKIYWCISSEHARGYSGPFVNHSNYGQFMNLSIGAALGLVMVKLHEVFGSKNVTAPVVFEYFSSALARPFWLLMLMISIDVVTVFISLTRGGMVSMLVAIAFTTVLLVVRKPLKSHGWVMVIMALIAFTSVLYLGFDAVYDRLGSLRDFDRAECGRLQILKDIAIAWTKFPITGTGLGTHLVVYPMFDRSTITALAAYAENEYAQVLEETGLVGLCSLIVFGVIVWLKYVRNIRNSGTAICSVAYGLGFGLLAILIHSLSDFGQHLPANSFLSVIFCALLLSAAKCSGNQSRDEQAIVRFLKFRWIGFVVLLGASAIWIWVLVNADKSRVAEAWWGKTLAVEKGLIEKNWQGTAGEYADLISCAARALERNQENVKYRYWLNVYRWRSISQQIDPNTGETIISEDSMPVVHDIVNQLHRASAICPTYGPGYSMVGQIEEFVLGDDSGAAKIRKGFRLAPCDPIACFVAACLDVSEGKPEASIEKFERAVQLDKGLFDKVVDIYVSRLSRPDLAMVAAGDDIHRLEYVTTVFDEMQYNDWAEQAREKMKDLIIKRCSEPDAPAWLFVSMADIYSKQRNDEAAIEYYRRALVLDYSQVRWRLDLARLLAKTNRVPEAIHEARICLRLRPQFKPAEELIGELTVRSDAFGGKGNYPDM